MIADVISAELLKLRKRPATWVTLGILAGVVILVMYLLIYLLVTFAPEDLFAGGPTPDVLLEGLFPAAVPSMVVQSVNGYGGALALIFGALTVGSEFNWRTATASSLQRPSRGTIMLARSVAVTVFMLVFAVIVLLSVMAGSLGVAALEGASLRPAAPIDLVASLWASWLVLAMWATLGMALATLFRGNGLAIGLGLVYALLLEGVVAVLPASIDAVRVIRASLPGQNATALAGNLAGGGQGLAALEGMTITISTPQAVAVLLAYSFTFAMLAVSVFARRELA